jgi:hypothetical protein
MISPSGRNTELLLLRARLVFDIHQLSLEGFFLLLISTRCLRCGGFDKFSHRVEVSGIELSRSQPVETSLSKFYPGTSGLENL